MQITVTRRVQPESIAASVTLETADIGAAFLVADPDEALFFDVFSPGFEGRVVSEKLMLLARVAALAERAVTLGLEAGEPEPKA